MVGVGDTPPDSSLMTPSLTCSTTMASTARSVCGWETWISRAWPWRGPWATPSPTRPASSPRRLSRAWGGVWRRGGGAFDHRQPRPNVLLPRTMTSTHETGRQDTSTIAILVVIGSSAQQPRARPSQTPPPKPSPTLTPPQVRGARSRSHRLPRHRLGRPLGGVFGLGGGLEPTRDARTVAGLS